jgi:hypothetical protein
MSATITRVTLDGHVHLYPRHDWVLALRALFRNLGSEGVRIGLLAESASCRFYQQVLDRPSDFNRDGLVIAPGPGPHALTVSENGVALGTLIAGRQIVTAERLEVLSLGTDASVADRQPLRRTIDAVRERGGVPVLSWSAGKWFFGRGRQVESLITTLPAGSILLGDSGLRPTCWPQPRLMRLGRQRGFKVIAGSDALPLRNEERWLGTYGVSAMAPFDSLAPADSVHRMLSYGNTIFTPVGQRVAPLPFLVRWLTNQTRRATPDGHQAGST